MNKNIRAVLLALLALALAVSISATLILSGVLLLEWAFESSSPATRRPWQMSPLDVPLFVFFCWNVVTACLHRSTGVLDAVSSQSALLLFYWAAHALDENDVSVFFKWFCAGAAFVGLLGICQHWSGVMYWPLQRSYTHPAFFEKWPDWLVHKLAVNNGRATGTRSHPLTYAETFIAAVFLLLATLTASFGRKLFSRHAVVLVCALAMVGSGVLLASGRAVWLGLVFGLGTFAWLHGRRFFMTFLGIFMLLTIPIFLMSSGVRGRFMSIVSPSSGSIGDQSSKSARFQLWCAGFEQMATSPVSGVGYKGALLNVPDPYDGKMRLWTETHNMFLQNAVEGGVVGLGLFLWILWIALSIFKNAPSSLRPAFLGMFVTFLIAGLTESWPGDKEIAMIFWVMIGCAQSLRTHEKI